MVAVAVAVAALFAAPATWAAETLGHTTSSTFPTGGPANVVSLGSGGPGGRGGFGGDNAALTAAIAYAKAHGGGTIALSSQSSAADAILSSDGDVAGLGGCSGRESSVSVKWLASEVAPGRLRWVIVDSTQGGGLPGDTRTGSQTAMDAVAKRCKAVTLKTSDGTATMYDCSGRAAAILAAAGSGGN
jgi:hypothetical protein